MSISKETRVMTVALIITLIGMIVLWGTFKINPAFFDSPLLNVENSYHFDFDQITSIPDVFLGIITLAAIITLINGKQRGKWISILCGFYLVFLGVIDYAPPINGQRTAISIIDVAGIGAINLWCVVLGLYIFLKSRKSRKGTATESAYNHHMKKSDTVE